jgi:hypothetical protein
VNLRQPPRGGGHGGTTHKGGALTTGGAGKGAIHRSTGHRSRLRTTTAAQPVGQVRNRILASRRQALRRHSHHHATHAQHQQPAVQQSASTTASPSKTAVATAPRHAKSSSSNTAQRWILAWAPIGIAALIVLAIICDGIRIALRRRPPGARTRFTPRPRHQ